MEGWGAMDIQLSNLYFDNVCLVRQVRGVC